jgi:hypothetical protein
VGGGGIGDFAAFTSSYPISWAEGSFPLVTNVTSVADTGKGDNAYSLQLNTNDFYSNGTAPALDNLCSGATVPGACQGWQQFIYDAYSREPIYPFSNAAAYMEYWLLNYNNSCPSGWSSYQNNCWKNSNAVGVPYQAITSLAGLVLTGVAGAQDTVTMLAADGTLYATSQSSTLSLNEAWDTAEFNVFGYANGSEANFNSGATILVQTLTDTATPSTQADFCQSSSFTGETNGLSLVAGSCCQMGGVAPGIQFMESNSSVFPKACTVESNDLIAWSGGTAAASGSALDGYFDSGFGQHVNYMDTNGHVRELYLNPSSGGWTDNDLTQLAIHDGSDPTPPARNSALDGYWRDDDGSQHVNFIDANNHVRELYIHPGAGWVNNDLTQLAIDDGSDPAGPASNSGLSSYWQASDNSQHVHFIDPNKHVHELYIHPGAGWVNNDLTKTSINGTLAAPGAISSYWQASDNSQHVNFVDLNGHVHELYFAQGASQWKDNDLSSPTHATPAAPGSALDGYWGGDGSQHVNFIDQKGHVHELYFPPGGSWMDVDLMNLASGAPAAWGSGLRGVWGRDSSQHVYYTDASSNVHELYINVGTGWANVVLGTGQSASGSRLAAYTGTDNSRHLDFLDTLGHVHEAYAP